MTKRITINNTLIILLLIIGITLAIMIFTKEYEYASLTNISLMDILLYIALSLACIGLILLSVMSTIRTSKNLTKIYVITLVVFMIIGVQLQLGGYLLDNLNI
jgi:hypothetical protein